MKSIKKILLLSLKEGKCKIEQADSPNVFYIEGTIYTYELKELVNTYSTLMFNGSLVVCCGKKE